MKIQLALDRFTIPEAVHITNIVQDSIDWVEIGTSLIKEFGISSIEQLKNEFPEKVMVADVKTIDNAKYEFEMCFKAGADVATVMGVSPLVTIETCMNLASKMNKQVMIDLLNTTEEQKRELLQYREAVFCFHVSKDEQELANQAQNGHLFNGDLSEFLTMKTAFAGGLTHESIRSLSGFNPSVAIIGSAITKAKDPAQAAFCFKQLIMDGKVEKQDE